MRFYTITIAAAILIGACADQQPEGLSEDRVEPRAGAVLTFPGYTEDPVSRGGSPRQCNGMHCCPDGYAMQGAYLVSNMFRCVRMSWVDPPGSENSKCYVDGPGRPKFTMRNNMHACQLGYYMKGLRLDSNLLTCCPVPDGIFAERVDGQSSPPTQYHSTAWNVDAHTCADFGAQGGSEEVMTGVHAVNNWYTCGI